jgi:hypothetical protein
MSRQSLTTALFACALLIVSSLDVQATVRLDANASARPLEALRASLDRGALDLKGRVVRSDRTLGELRSGVTGSRGAINDPDDAYWASGFELSGLNGGVGNLVEFQGKVIAAGGFYLAGGIEVNAIAAWDGTSWSPLGSGVDAGIYALTVYDGKLIAGGWFTHAGGVQVGFIAAWDGSQWSSLGSGENSSV